MIFVTVGTQDKQFKRLFLEIERLIEVGIIKDNVVAQVGSTKYVPKLKDRIKVIEYTQPEEMNSLIEQADIIITHGGVATIIEAMNHKKKIIAVPRLRKYREHVNDHQLQIIENFNDNGYLIGTNGVEDLEDALNKVDKFSPKQYKSNNENFVDRLEKCIIM